MNTISKIKEFFFFTKEDHNRFLHVKQEIIESNRTSLMMFSIIGLVFTATLLALTLVFDVLKSSRECYLCCMVSLMALYLVAKGPAKTRPWLTILSVNLFVIVLLCVTIAFGTFIDPTHVSVSYVLLVFSLPLLFTQRPRCAIAAPLISIFIYVPCALLTQEPGMFDFNMSVVLPYGLIGMIITTFVMKIKINSFLLQDKSTVLEKISSLNEIITEEKNKQELFHDIISKAGIGLWTIVLAEGKEPQMKCDDQMNMLLGIDPNSKLTPEQTYDFWYSRINANAVESVQKSVAKIIERGFDENTYLWRHPMKGEVYVRCGGSSTKKDGVMILSGYHAIVTDIVLENERYAKELRVARDEANAANAAKTTFLFNMSHDIRTPMNAILGFTNLMEQRKDDPQIVENYIGKIKTSGNYLLSLINNVLDMARIESGNAKLEEDFYDLLASNNNATAMFDELARKKNITLTRTDNIQHRYVMLDKMKVHQIMVNLMSNAIKYTPEGGTVSYSFEEIPSKREGYATFVSTFEDNGIGMTKEFAAKVFDMFSRERNTTDSKVNGTGLGMSIVKKLLDLMGGTIEIETEPGKGTTIKVTISHRIVENPEAYLGNKQQTEKETVSLAGCRVLLAEDNELNAEIVQTILEEQGIECDLAEDGVVCVKKLSEAEAGYYDAILMDIQMPNLNGYEATKRIRQLSDTKKAGIPIIALTANAFDEDRRNALAAGMNEHLAKPIDVQKLMEALCASVSHYVCRAKAANM